MRYAAAEVDAFIEVADALEDAFPDVAVDGEEAPDDAPAGTFVVELADGTVVFSRGAAGEKLPPPEELVALLDAALKR